MPSLSPEGVESLKRLLWSDSAQNVYAVLDGASNPDLLDHLYAEPQPEFECLYMGELEPDVAECAPYLVLLERDSALTDWLLAEGWGKHWGIFTVAPMDLRGMRHHFRKLNIVYGPDSKPLLFRYYDPRVLASFLPTCDDGQVTELFGPITLLLGELSNDSTVACYSLRRGAGLKITNVPVRAASGSSDA
jgi:hypothetical protein